MKRKAMVMRLKILGIAFILGLGFSIMGIGSEAKTTEDDAIIVEVKRMVINEAPVEVKANEIDEVIEVVEEDAKYIFYDIALTEDEQKLMQDVCKETGVNYEFALAIMKSESNFRWVEGDQNLKHHAIGYFQISTINEERMDEQYSLDIHDRMDNIAAGIHIIAELQNKFIDGYKGYFDTETAVVMCYKCGEGRGKELMADGIILKVVDVIKTDMEAFK